MKLSSWTDLLFAFWAAASRRAVSVLVLERGNVTLMYTCTTYSQPKNAFRWLYTTGRSMGMRISD